MPNEDALELVRLRNNFYRDSYHKVLVALLFMIIVNIILSGIIAYIVSHQPKPEYFATTSDGKLIPLYPLTRPVLSTAELLQWATLAATSATTYNFVNYRKELQAAAQYFTPAGWKEYQASLKASRNLEAVVAKKLTASAVPTGSPIVIEQGVVNGVYKWKVELPLLITYESASTKITQPSLVTMLITRVSTLEMPKGIAIDAFYMSEQSINK